MQDVVLDLLRRQQSAGFPDVSGAEAAATIPVSDRLVNELVAAALPKDRPVQDLHIQSEAGGRFKVRLRLGGSTLLPSITVTLTIEEQPDLPARPVLGLRLSGIPKLLLLTGGLVGMGDRLPPGVTMDGDHIRLNLETLLRQRGQAELLRYLTALNVTTRDGTVVVAFRARVP